MLSLSTIDTIVQRFGIVNILVDKIVSKIAPAVPVSALPCPGGYYNMTTSYGSIKKCQLDGMCGSGKKCIRNCTFTYFYHFAPYACQEQWWCCMGTSCPGGLDSEC